MSVLRPNWFLTTFVVLLASAVVFVLPAHAIEPIQGPGGPSASYDFGGENCTGGGSDPVGVVFRGTHASAKNVSASIKVETLRYYGYEGGHGTETRPWIYTENDAGHRQSLSVKEPDGSYGCENNNESNAEAPEAGPFSRYHIRLWFIPATSGKDEVKTVGTPHHERYRSPTEYSGCPGPTGLGNHAIDKGGIHQNDHESGFDMARHAVRNVYESGPSPHNVVSEQWGNTAEFAQCDGEYAGSDGSGLVVPGINNEMYAQTLAFSEYSNLSGKLNGSIVTSAPTTRYWFGYGPYATQGSGYPHKTPVQTISGATEVDVHEPISGLSPGTTYHIRLFLENQAGVVVEGNEIEYTTPCADNPELFGVDMSGTGTHQTEVHSLKGETAFSTFQQQIGTALSEVSPTQFDFSPGDLNCDGGQYDLFAIDMNHTQTHTTELHVYNGWSNYATPLLEIPTALEETNPEEWEFVVGYWNPDNIPDILAIHMNHTQSHMTEVHILDGPNYSTFNTHLATILPETYPWQWQFLPVDFNGDGRLDLFGVDMNHTGTHMTEVHILDGATNFSTYWTHLSTPLQETYASRWQFSVLPFTQDGRPDLVAVNLSGTGSGKTEAHVLDGATNYSTFFQHIATALPETDARTWEFGGSSSIGGFYPVKTGDAEPLRQEVLMKGTVNSHGLPTEYWFEYGYASQGWWEHWGPINKNGNAGEGNEAVEYSFKGKGLTEQGLPDGNYKYRIAAKNAEGTFYGETKNFVIDNSPLVKAGAATNITSGSATLNGEVEPQNFDSTYHFEVVDDSGFQSDGFSYAMKVPKLDVSAGTGLGYRAVSQDTGTILEPGTLYHYRLAALNSKGWRYSNEGTFRTLAVTPTKDLSWGKEGTSGNGVFEHIVGVATDNSGNVYVGDSGVGSGGLKRIQKFDASGVYQSQFAQLGSGEGAVEDPTGIAFAPSGSIWVADAQSWSLKRYSAAGAFVERFGNTTFNFPMGVAIDQSNGNIWVADTGHGRLMEFNSAHQYLRTVTGGGGNGPELDEPQDVDIDVSGNVWTVDASEGRVLGYTSSGTYIGQIGTKGTGSGQLNVPHRLAFLPSGALVIQDGVFGASRLQVFSKSGVYLGVTIAQPSGPYVGEIATYGNRLYVVEEGNKIRQVTRYHVPQVIATTGAASNVKISHAVVAGTIDPAGSPVTYRIEYGPTKGYGSVAPAPDKALGSENGAQAISQELTELTPKTTYHYRVAAFNANGASYGKDATFETAGPPPLPTATTEDATAIGPSHATFNATINPNEGGTRYLFQYGKTTSYGKYVPAGPNPNTLVPKFIGRGVANVKVAETPALEPNSTYHFRIEATNEAGTVYGADKIVTTPPAVSGPPSFVTSFGSAGTGEGQFSNVYGIAVDSKGNGWVVDASATTSRVEKFNSSGVYQSQFGSYGTGNGQLRNPRGIAVDAADNLYVVDLGNGRIEKFDPSGQYLSQFGKGKLSSPNGLTVDPKGNVWVMDAENGLVKFNSAGEYLGTYGSEGSADGQFLNPREGIASDADGNVWVPDNGNNRIEEFGPLGEFLGKFGAVGTGNGQFKSPRAVAVDPQGNLWVTDGTNNRVQQVFPEGEYVTQFGKEGIGPGEFKTPTYIAVDSARNVWVVDSQNKRVEIWKRPDPYAVETETATSVKRTEATLKATINPGGDATSYQFEYGPTATFGTAVPAAAKSIGSGTQGIKVSQAIAGLKPATTYYYHVAAVTSGGTSYGETRRFKTPPAVGANAKWRIGGKTFAELGLTEVPISIEGSTLIEINQGGNKTKFSCTDYGNGTLTPTGLSKETPHHECSMVGAPTCKVNPIWYTVNGKYEPEGGIIGIVTPNCWYESVSLSGFSGSFEYGSEAVGMGMNLNATGKFGGNPVTLTTAGRWWLTGSQVGKTLGYEEGAPEVFTQAASGVKGTEATLNGTVNPLGFASTYRFEYGATTSYGTSVPASASSVGSGTVAVAKTAALSGLAPGATYHYRITASSNRGTAYGKDLTFTTTGGAPDTTITGGSAGKVTPDVSFAFSSSESGSTFECALDASAYGACTSPQSYEGLVEGVHTFKVRAVKGGVADTTPAERTVTVKETAKAVSGVAVLDEFGRSEIPLATSKWTKTNWATQIGACWAEQWHGYGGWGSTLVGAYWNSGTFSDASAGLLASATVGTGSVGSGEYTSLWLDMPSPGSIKSGYEARFSGTNGSASAYKVELSKWVGGTRTVLATKEAFSLPANTTFLLTETGGTLGIWTGTTSFSRVISAYDTTYSSGYAGIETYGGNGTSYNFRAGNVQ